MSRDPANDARLAREDRARQQAFREQGERASAKIREEAKAAAANREYIERMRSNDRKAAQSNHSSYESPQSYSTPSNDETAPYHGNGSVGGSGSIARVVKTLFVVGALYGAYDGIKNQSSIGGNPPRKLRKLWMVFPMHSETGSRALIPRLLS
jgi:hypothetical protein